MLDLYIINASILKQQDNSIEYFSSKSIFGVYCGSFLPEHNFCPFYAILGRKHDICIEQKM